MVSMISEEGRTKVGIYEYVIDTATELSEVPTDVQIGSIVYCIENSKKYMLDSSGNYVEVNFKKGGSGGEAKLGTKDIDENGSYKASDFDLDGWSQVNVNIDSSGGSSYKLIKSEEVEVNTTSTSAISVSTISCGESAWTSDDILFIHIHDKAGARSGYFYEFFAYVINNTAKNAGAYDYTINILCNGIAVNNNYYTSTGGSYGVFPTNLSPNGDITIKAKYGSTTSRTIDGTYTVDVYKLSMPNNESPFA